jgi:hypothetical protein
MTTVTITVAYYDTELITTVKMLAPSVNLFVLNSKLY